MIHGGDIYRNEIELDYSVNVNPLGAPKSVIQALRDAVNRSVLPFYHGSIVRTLVEAEGFFYLKIYE